MSPVPEIGPGVVDDDVVRELARRGVLVPLVRSAPPPRRPQRTPTLHELIAALEDRCRARGYTCSTVWIERRGHELLERDELPRWVRAAIEARREVRAQRRDERLKRGRR